MDIKRLLMAKMILTRKCSKLGNFINIIVFLLKMALDGLVNVRGLLAHTFSQLDLSTIQHSDEITNARREDESLRNKWFWTADFPLYVVKNGKPILYLARGENNLIFKNIEEAIPQLVRNKNYVPRQEDISSVIEAESTLRIDPANLKLNDQSDEYSFLIINTPKYRKLNKEQRKVAERAYGQGDDFKENMEMLLGGGITETVFCVLNPEYVKEHAEEGSAIARACMLSSFGVDSCFVASGSGVIDTNVFLRGVPRVSESYKKPTEQPHANL